MHADNLRVLVVEDDYFIASDIVAAATKQRMKVIGPASNLADAQSIAAVQGCDVAIVDIGLGDEKAFPLLDQLMAAKVPVVLVTGYDQECLPVRYRGMPYFQKPFRAKDVIDVCKGAEAARLL